jgi:phospholipase/carboxylesterase
MLEFRERPASQDPDGLLILHHGRGSDELDLLGLADILDPERRLHVVAPRAPLRLSGFPGYHWYRVMRVGYPDPGTFAGSVAALSALHDELWSKTGLEAQRTVLGGFSMGSVMSYALGLHPDRPAPAGILAFSGFIPTVENWRLDLKRSDVSVFIAHGRRDPVIDVSFARGARDLLQGAGFPVEYHESDAMHNIDPPDVPRAVAWLSQVLPRSA